MAAERERKAFAQGAPKVPTNPEEKENELWPDQRPGQLAPCPSADHDRPL